MCRINLFTFLILFKEVISIVILFKVCNKIFDYKLINEGLISQMNKVLEQDYYSKSVYNIPNEKIIELEKLDPQKSYFSIFSIWAQIALLMFLITSFIPSNVFWFAYVPLIFVIAGRQGFLLQLVHEGSHNLLHPNRKTNNSIGQWLCGLPIGVDFYGFTSGHIQHHGFAGTDKDPKSDSDKYEITNFRDARLFKLFLKDMLGYSALLVFFNYSGKKRGSKSNSSFKDKFYPLLSKLTKLSIVQLVVLTLVFRLNILDYILLWIIPAATAHMVLMRFRGIAEHGLAKQLSIKVKKPDTGVLYTRSFYTNVNKYKFSPLIWLEKLLIGTLDVNYHHEHHVFPKVPHYNLHKAHELISEKASKINDDIYAKGYFSAALRSLFHKPV